MENIDKVKFDLGNKRSSEVRTEKIDLNSIIPVNNQKEIPNKVQIPIIHPVHQNTLEKIIKPAEKKSEILKEIETAFNSHSSNSQNAKLSSPDINELLLTSPNLKAKRKFIIEKLKTTPKELIDEFLQEFPTIDTEELITKILNHTASLHKPRSISPIITSDLKNSVLKPRSVSPIIISDLKNSVLKPKNSSDLKKQLCPRESTCSTPNCKFYHFQGERRRHLENYSAIICKIPNCNNFEHCSNAHTQSEVFFHPLVYLKVVCPFKECPLGEFCSFCHKTQDFFVSLEEKMEIEIMNALDYKEEVDGIKKKMEKEIGQLGNERKRLRQLLVCCSCEVYRVEYVFSVCGHCVCCFCMRKYAERYSCSKCDVLSSYIRIEYE